MKELPKSLTDKQEMFNAAYRGLAAQGWVQSMGEDRSCLYRGPYGKKCAIGHCIPDELFEKRFEGDEASLVLFRLVGPQTLDLYIFANSLQDEHDLPAQSPEEMRQRLEAFAKLHNLTIPQD